MIPHANIARQFLDAPPLAPGEQQLSDSTRNMPPDEQAIGTFFEFTGGAVDRVKAIKFIDGAGGNAMSAVEEYFNNPTKYDNDWQGWDESQFHAERDGSNVAPAGIPSFSIDAGEDQGIYLGGSSAPTRPPSRRSNYSTKSGQENGVINGMGQDQSGATYFGPPTRDAASYVPEQWAMVPLASSARVYDNPDAMDRQRNKENGEPVCFKPLREKDPLPSLITVLGQIPRSRKELLFENVQLQSYGGSDKWWDGQRATARGVDQVDNNTFPQQDVVAETQRLMAFIQGSDRSYGSVEVLEKLDGISNETTANIVSKSGDFTGELRFLVGWSAAAEMFAVQQTHEIRSTASPGSAVFRTVMMQREMVNGVLEDSQQPIYRLDFSMSTSEPKRTLYNTIDSSLWQADPLGDSDDEFYIDQAAPVLVVSVKNKHTVDGAKGLGLQVPPIFYADRYLKRNTHVMKAMRQKKAVLRQELVDIQDRKIKLEQLPHPKDSEKVLDREELFKNTIEHLRRRDKAPSAQEKPRIEANDTAMEDAPALTEWDHLADKLERYHSKLQTKIKDLEELRIRVEQQMSDLSNILTENDDATAHTQPIELYSLRGVGIGPDYETTFVYVDPAPASDLSDMDADGQWWRFEFPSQRNWTAPTKKPVTELEVLSEASNEAKEALLIYASKSACDPANPENATSPLWPSLQAFVDEDNMHFDAELREQQALLPVADYADWSGDHPPPSYDEAVVERVEHVNTDEKDQVWVEDPGPTAVPDAEYVANTNYAEIGAHTDELEGLGSGRGVSSEVGGMRNVDDPYTTEEYQKKDEVYRH